MSHQALDTTNLPPNWHHLPTEEKVRFLERLKQMPTPLRPGQVNPPPPSSAPSEYAKFLEPQTWREWLERFLSGQISAGFSERHVAFWEWGWSIQKGVRPRPFVALWPRGGGKSASAEMLVVMLGLRGVRRYFVYVCSTQEQADAHVASIAAMLERLGVDRALNKYGNSKGWRRNRLYASNGMVLDALGLDTASRGIRVENDRVGFFVLDESDELEDSLAVTLKKKRAITQTILPAGNNESATLFIQNLITANSLASQLADGRADFLVDRIVSGPYKAIDNLEIEYRVVDGKVHGVITGGTATWDGQDIAACQGTILTVGFPAFDRESQQNVSEVEGALWKLPLLERMRITDVPGTWNQIVVAVDPTVTSGGDEAGIVVAGVTACGCMGTVGMHGFCLDDVSLGGSPETWGKAAVAAYRKWGAHRLVAESNQGGELVRSVLSTVPGAPPVELIHASDGKRARAEPIASLSSQGLIHLVGHFPKLEGELSGWSPNSGLPSPNRLDALVYAMSAIVLTATTAQDVYNGLKAKVERMRVAAGKPPGG